MLAYKTAANIIACFGILIPTCTAQTQGTATAYPKMAPLQQYMMERNTEVALARSAAPEAISKEATVLVLTSHGFETAVAGRNGWTCYVDRGWAGMVDHPEFWNPKIRAASCLNPIASRSFLPYERMRAELVLAGHSKEEIITATWAAIRNKTLPALEPGGMCYMMSKTAYLTDEGTHSMAHVMFYTSDEGSALGADAPGSPFIGGSYWSMSPDAYPQLKTFPPIYVSIIGTDQWSDGTPAPHMSM